jgi:hypothetical protein
MYDIQPVEDKDADEHFNLVSTAGNSAGTGAL